MPFAYLSIALLAFFSPIDLEFWTLQDVQDFTPRAQVRNFELRSTEKPQRSNIRPKHPDGHDLKIK